MSFTSLLARTVDIELQLPGLGEFPGENIHVHKPACTHSHCTEPQNAKGLGSAAKWVVTLLTCSFCKYGHRSLELFGAQCLVEKGSSWLSQKPSLPPGPRQESTGWGLGQVLLPKQEADWCIISISLQHQGPLPGAKPSRWRLLLMKVGLWEPPHPPVHQLCCSDTNKPALTPRSDCVEVHICVALSFL